MHYRTNEKLEAINSLEFVSEQVDKVSDDISKWKWIIIGLHNALQNYMVCALRGTENTNVLSKKSSNNWLTEFFNRMHSPKDKWKYPEERLDSFTNLFEKMQSDMMKKYSNGKAFIPTQSQIDSVIDLNLFRNEFIHFVPKGWSLGITGLPTLVVEVLGIIEFLAFESSNIRWSEESEKTRTRNAISNIKNKFTEQI
jgi:hypothetical protein